MNKFGHLHRKQKVSDRASLHQPSRPRPGPPPCPGLLTVCVSEADAAAPHAAPPHCPRQQGLCAHKTRGQTSGNIESFSFLSSHPLHLLLLYFCGRRHHLHPLLFSSPLQTQITSAWPKSDTASILFLINLAHWQSLLNNKACHFSKGRHFHIC